MIKRRYDFITLLYKAQDKVKNENIKIIGVAGEGKMGTSIFLYLNGFDMELVWLCSSESASLKAKQTFLKKTRFLYQSGLLTEAEYIDKKEKTVITSSVDDLKDCDLIIEAVTEDLQIKRRLFVKMDRCINVNCIFASNSSSIIPSQLLEVSESRKAKIAGLHFFFPVLLKNTVELISASSTSPQTRTSLTQFLQQINKKPFHQDESNAFVLNRALLECQAEAFQILTEGKISVQEIDELVKQHIFPMGIFEFFDHVGIDVMLASVKSYIMNFENKVFYLPMVQKMEEMVKLNLLGTKTCHGFYNASLSDERIELEQMETEAMIHYKSLVLDRLWNNYIGSVERIVEQGICTRTELASYLKDYLGKDTDPFIMNTIS